LPLLFVHDKMKQKTFIPKFSSFNNSFRILRRYQRRIIVVEVLDRRELHDLHPQLNGKGKVAQQQRHSMMQTKYLQYL
jgi:hypothetical protein